MSRSGSSALVLFASVVVSAPSVARADATTNACVDASDEGQAARERGELLRAREAFTACAGDQCPRALRADCARWLEDVARDTPSVVVGVKDDKGEDVLDGRVLLDGKPVDTSGAAVLVDPGPHIFRFERPGAVPVERRLVVRTGERNRLVVEKVAVGTPHAEAPVARSGGLPTGTWVLGAVGVAGLAAFGTLGFIGLSEKDQLQSTCSPRCTDDDVANLRALYVTADISLAVSLVAFAAAAWIAIDAGGQKSARVRGPGLTF